MTQRRVLRRRQHILWVLPVISGVQVDTPGQVTYTGQDVTLTGSTNSPMFARKGIAWADARFQSNRPRRALRKRIHRTLIMEFGPSGNVLVTIDAVGAVTYTGQIVPTNITFLVSPGTVTFQGSSGIGTGVATVISVDVPGRITVAGQFVTLSGGAQGEPVPGPTHVRRAGTQNSLVEV